MTKTTVNNDSATVGGITYNIPATDGQLIEADFSANGTASDHVRGTPTIGDGTFQLPSAAGFTGTIMFAVKTHCSDPTVLAGKHNIGSTAFGNFAYIAPATGETIVGVATALNSSLLNNSIPTNNTATLVGDGVSNWYLMGRN